MNLMKKNIILNNIYYIYKYMCDGGYSSVVRESEFKSKDPGFNPLVVQRDQQFFCPSDQINSCAGLFTWHTPKFVRMLKIPCPSVISNIASALDEIHWQNNKNQHTAPVDSFFDATGASI
jgi:hypothetical protein